MKKLVLGVTLPGSSRLLDGQVKYFISLGYKVYLLSPNHPKEIKFCLNEGCTHLPVNISNEINPFYDLISLFQIIKHLIRVKPHIINVGTPKMGLLGILAAWILRYPKRVYTCRGLRYETEYGVKKFLLKRMEKLTALMASHVIYVSRSLLQASINNNTAISSKSKILANGSSNGVDLKKFDKDSVNSSHRQKLVDQYNLHHKVVIGFVGRITRDKGSYELVSAFERLQKNYSNLKLIMMGHIKSPPEFIKRFKSNSDIVHIPFNDDVTTHMSLFDFLVLPSWREGFPNV
ncbi:MAG: glycosyltransferase, partial [Cyclobacteriaceae bacterium]